MTSPLLSPSSFLRRKRRLTHFIYTFVAFILLAVFIYSYDFVSFSRRSLHSPTILHQSTVIVVVDEPPPPSPPTPAFAVGKTPEGCDVFKGKWVKDRSTRPFYDESECPYIQPQLTCRTHGRPDSDYLSWRWQPESCSLPSLVSLSLDLKKGERSQFLRSI